MLKTTSSDSLRKTQGINRLMLCLFAVTLAAMWSAIAYYISQSYTARIEEEQRVLSRMARVVREQTGALFSLLDYFFVSTDSYFQAHPNVDPRSNPAFLKLVAEFRARTGNLIDIRFVSSDGGLYYVGTPKNAPLADVSDRDYFLALKQPDAESRPFIASPVLSRVTGQWGLPIAYPLKSRPQGIAVIFAAIENRALTPSFEEGRTKPNGTILLAHLDGTVLFRSPEEDTIGKSLALTRGWNDKVIPKREGVFRVIDTPLDDKTRIGAYTTLPDYPLVVVATSSMDDALSGWRSRSIGLTFFGLFVTTLGLIMLSRMSNTMRELSESRRQLEQHALIDDLTQIPNRRYYFEQGKLELARSTRYQRPLSLLMLDIDHFKNINDSLGHETGDLVLKSVSAAIRSELRATDTLGRLGGEEFSIILPETPPPMAEMTANRVRQAIESMSLSSARGEPISVTASIGIATSRDADESIDQLLARADQALYRAKHAGRNCIRAEDTD